MRLLFQPSVFFHSSITQCEEASFYPTHRRCQAGHTQAVRVNVHSLHTFRHTLIWMMVKVMALTHTLSPSLITLFSWLCLFSPKKTLVLLSSLLSQVFPLFLFYMD